MAPIKRVSFFKDANIYDIIEYINDLRNSSDILKYTDEVSGSWKSSVNSDNSKSAEW